MIAVSVQDMQKSDNQTVDCGVNAKDLISNAAKAIFENIKDLGDRFILFCGKGNNGADGYRLAEILKSYGRVADVFAIELPGSQECKYFADKLQKTPFNELSQIDIESYDIAVDCLLGTGFCGNLKQNYIDAIEVLNKAKFIVACDIPSGLNGNNGRVKIIGVKANITIGLGFAKLGYYLNDGKDYCGEIKVCNIGITLCGDGIEIVDDTVVKQYFCKRLENTHKGIFGKALVVGGSSEYPGAVKLSALACINAIGESALRTGCGLVCIATQKSVKEAMAGVVTDCTLIGYEDLEFKNIKSMAVGMGMGVSAVALLERILEQKINKVLDADALNIISTEKKLLEKLNRNTIITPHIKEMSRLCGCSVEEILNNPIGVAKDFAIKFNTVVVLKGTSTIVTNGVKTVLINRGTCGQAKGGSGDVLSGVIAGLLARGIGLFESAYCGCYINGIAGELARNEFGEYGMLASDSAKFVAYAIKNLQ